MKQESLKSKLRLTVAALFLAALLVWAFFYAATSRSLVRSAEESAVQAARHVISILEEEFLQLERISFTLSQSAAVKDFAAERDFLRYHEKAQRIYGLLAGMRDQAEFVEHLIVFSSRDVYYRFWGSMSNTAATKVFYAISTTEQPRELIVTLEGMRYIGYTVGLYGGGGEALGAIVLLIEESKLQTLFVNSRANNALQISLAADSRIVSTSDPGLADADLEEALGQASFSDSRKVGFTPYRILVTISDGDIRQSMSAFALATAIAAAIFAILLLLFTRAFDRSFFSPMLAIMEGVERLGKGEENALPAYQEESFDRLAGEINNMLRRLDDRNKELFRAEMQLQQAEITKQKAIIVSLKKQISAHFTVNVLSIIKRLAELGEMQKTSDLCDGLAHLLQYANAGDEYIGGLEEFFILQQYVDIMQIRYQSQFRVEFDPDEHLGDVSIPRMLIQPLIENAIQHGLRLLESGGRLTVRARMEASRLTIKVEDNGAGMEPGQLEALRRRIAEAEERDVIPTGLEHVALVNIQRRVRSYYGRESGLAIDSAPGRGTSVTLVLEGVCSSGEAKNTLEGAAH